MRIISAEEEINYKSKKEINVKLPEDWWFATYSFNFFAKDENTEVNIIPFNKNISSKSNEKISEEILPTPSEWDFSKGDYRIQETGSTNQQYAYNDRLKIRIIKYSIYPAVFFSLLFTFIVLNTIVGS